MIQSMAPGSRERGSALVLALFLVVILTVLGLGLVLRTRTSMAVAASERPITKNFYAADAGIQAAFARLQVRNPCPFVFHRTDVRGPGGGGYPIAVTVAQSLLISSQPAVGSSAGGGLSEGNQAMVMMQYRLNAAAFEQATETRRSIEAEVVVGPTKQGIQPPCGP